MRAHRRISQLRPLLVAGVALAAAAALVPGVGAVRLEDVLPFEKQVRLDHERALDARAKQPPAKPADPWAEAPRGQAADGWPTGLFEDDESALPGVQVVTNRWVGVVGSSHVAVYAGAAASDPQQGLIVTMTLGQGGDAIALSQYRTPRGSGQLRIEMASAGNVLRLRSASGAAFGFDVAARRFVAAPAR